ncbi:LAFE_0D12618g1_1 [Lachancea fermentati]|uniref:DNA damage checkpoint control protein RAD17 n=1 Tax=Lachancea fermentati TaxID=4955 RepID=A0A1G4MC69_LACFM|nr:LAFE_0D12618g1_1 [Lachancea fermentati]
MLNQDLLFSASTVHLEHITTALNCLIPFGIKEDVLIIIDKDGLSFARANNRVISIQLFLSKELFIAYNYNGPSGDPDSHTKVCVKINHILDSISVANRDKDDVVECTLSYNGEGSPLILIFEDSMISERVEYSTYLLKDLEMADLEPDRDRLMFECIIRGDVLYNALQDLKEIGCKECYIYAITKTDGRNIFALISKSQLGLSKVVLPGERTILEKLEVYSGEASIKVDNCPVIGYFDFSTFDKMRMSAKIASKILLRKDIHGLLNVNILSQTDNVILVDSKITSKMQNTSDIRNAQLPKDYPGIVIDISILEKVHLEEFDVQEINLLMESPEEAQTKAIYQPSRPNDDGKVSTKDLDGNYDNNFLGLTKKRRIEDVEHESDDENYQPVTKDMPLFF